MRISIDLRSFHRISTTSSMREAKGRTKGKFENVLRSMNEVIRVDGWHVRIDTTGGLARQCEIDDGRFLHIATSISIPLLKI